MKSCRRAALIRVRRAEEVDLLRFDVVDPQEPRAFVLGRICARGETKARVAAETPLVLAHCASAPGLAVVAEAVGPKDLRACERSRALLRRPPKQKQAGRVERAIRRLCRETARFEAELVFGAA